MTLDNADCDDEADDAEDADAVADVDADADADDDADADAHAHAYAYADADGADANYQRRNDQKTQRPKATSRAGSKVKIVITEQIIPIAPTGPNPLFPDRSLSSRTIKAVVVVAPDATIGSTTPRRAAFIASKGKSKW